MRQISLVFISLAMMVISIPANSQPSSAAHSPEWTNLQTSDPGEAAVAVVAPARLSEDSGTENLLQPSKPADSVRPELEKIAALCATEDGLFAQAWVTYVRDNELKGHELQTAMRYVVKRAIALRSTQSITREQSQHERWARNRHRQMAQLAGFATLRAK